MLRLGRYQSTSAPTRAQRADQHRRRGDAVDVVVAVDGDPAAAADVAEDPLRRLPEAAERVERVLVGRRQERARGRGLAMPRRTSTWASTPDTPSSRGRRSAAANSYGSRVRRASWWITRQCMDCGPDGTAAAQQFSGVWDERSRGYPVGRRWRRKRGRDEGSWRGAPVWRCRGRLRRRRTPSRPTAAGEARRARQVDAAADAACKKANKAIAKRGWPVNLIDLDRLTVRAVTDVRAASKTIRRRRRRRARRSGCRPFVQSAQGARRR